MNQSKRLLDSVEILFFGIIKMYWILYKHYTVTYIHLLLFIFSTTITGKVHESQILLPERIYYNFVPYTKSEGNCTEDFINIMVKVRI